MEHKDEEIGGGIDTAFEEIERKYGYPPALISAILDNFDYALKVVTGEIFRFESVTAINREWIVIHGDVVDEEGYGKIGRYSGAYYTFPGERGTDICVDKIVWVKKAPEGS